VEERLLNGIVQRFQAGVATQSLREVEVLAGVYCEQL